MGPQWIPGIWLGKTSEGTEDQHVVSTVNGVMKGKAIRRNPDPWRGPWLFLMRDKPYKSVSSRKAVKFDATPPVLPRIVEDRDAEDALEHGDSDDEIGTPVPLGELGIGSSTNLEQKATHKREASTNLEELEHDRALERIGDQAPQTPEELHEVFDDSGIPERETKAAKMSPPTSPTPGSVLFPPHYAGGVHEAHYVDDIDWEDEVLGDLEEELGELDYMVGFGESEEFMDERKPPNLTEEEMATWKQQLEKEIERLFDIQVIADPTPDELETGAVLSTRSVFHWRWRNDKWTRRCRFVAREFKGYSRGSQETFAPTSATMWNRLMLALQFYVFVIFCRPRCEECFSFGTSTGDGAGWIPSWWKPSEIPQDGSARY